MAAAWYSLLGCCAHPSPFATAVSQIRGQLRSLSQTTLDAGIPWILEQMKTVRAQTSLDHKTCTSMKGEESQCTGFSWLSWAQRTTGSKLPWFEGCRKLCKTHSAQTALLNTVYFLTCISVPQPLFKFPGK